MNMQTMAIDDGREGAAECLSLWLDEVPREAWYSSSPELDAKISDRFATKWEQALAGGLTGWLRDARGCLAYIILTDQFSRNMFRGDGRSFATDALARRAAKRALDRGWDLKTPEPERIFFYMPLEHSECIEDQERAVRLVQARMPLTGAEYLLHARAHREVIRSFGRFPNRNAALGRPNSVAEQQFLDEGGYGATVRKLSA